MFDSDFRPAASARARWQRRVAGRAPRRRAAADLRHGDRRRLRDPRRAPPRLRRPRPRRGDDRGQPRLSAAQGSAKRSRTQVPPPSASATSNTVGQLRHQAEAEAQARAVVARAQTDAAVADLDLEGPLVAAQRDLDAERRCRGRRGRSTLATASVTATAIAAARVRATAPSSCRERDRGVAGARRGRRVRREPQHRLLSRATRPAGSRRRMTGGGLFPTSRVQREGMDELRKERLAINEALFRNVNEGIRAGTRSRRDARRPLRVRALGCNRLFEIDRRLRGGPRAPAPLLLLRGTTCRRSSGRRAPRRLRRRREGGGAGRSPTRPTRAAADLALGQRQLRAEGDERAAEGPAHPGQHLGPA